MNKQYKKVLSIAGSDSGGGAGIQADIKAISACGCYALTAITAITVQNTVGVHGVWPVPVEAIKGQISAVLGDIGADAVKIGMLHSSEVITAVRDCLTELNAVNIVLDPVMVATSGDRLLLDDAIESLKSDLIPIARIITPNIPEAEILLGRKYESYENAAQMAIDLSMGRKVSVLLKAGHLTGPELTDIFYNAEEDSLLKLSSVRTETKNTHGTGCSLSSAIAAFLAKGFSMNDAVKQGKKYISNAILKGAGYSTGEGHGPVHHFYNFWE